MSEENKTETVAETSVKQKKPKKKLTKLEKWFRFMRRVHKALYWFLLPYKKYGHIERFNDRSYIIVGNHRSVLDVIPAALATDKPVHYMAKKELFEKGIAKWFTKKCECIPVNRDGNDVRAIMQAMKYLKEGSVVCIFPEGTRNKTEDLFLPFKSGATALSIKTKTPIIPMLQLKKIKLFRKSHIYYGEPLEFKEYYDKKLTQEDIDRADEILLNKLEEAYHELENLTAKKSKKKVK